jgi:hypothetical protein
MSDDRTPNQQPTRYRGEEKDIGIPKHRMRELVRHYAEIQRYQKDNDLDDKGDPPHDEHNELT